MSGTTVRGICIAFSFSIIGLGVAQALPPGWTPDKECTDSATHGLCKVVCTASTAICPNGDPDLPGVEWVKYERVSIRLCTDKLLWACYDGGDAAQVKCAQAKYYLGGILPGTPGCQHLLCESPVTTRPCTYSTDNPPQE